MTRGLIVNPQSGKASGKGLELASLLKADTHVIVRVLDDFSQLHAFLAEMAEARVTDLFVSSGDGTIQAIQTEIAERYAPAFFPRLALLPHGTTNMTAADLGFRNRNVKVQADFIANREPRLLLSRPTLRVANPKDGKARHGMFLGTGAVWQATLFCQDAVHGVGLKGDMATFATLAAAIAKSLFSAADPADQTRIDRPYQIGLSRDGADAINGHHLLLLATTLDKLILGTRPFWRQERSDTCLHYSLPGSQHRALAAAPDVWRRRPRAPAGAHSLSGSAFEITTRTPFVIDGEFFEGPEDGLLHLETGPEFTYVSG